MDCRQPLFRQQKIIENDGSFSLDDNNYLILERQALIDNKELCDYIKAAAEIKRFSGKSAFNSVKPRKEVCYTINGEPYIYSGISHCTSLYPQHVAKVIPLLLEIVSKHLNSLHLENPYQEVSNAVDILYSPEFKNGGSIGAHADDEDDWGLVIIFSLGQTRWLRVRRNSDGSWYNVKMTHNSMIAMYGETFQTNYTHQVDKLSASEPVGTRLSLNVRFKKGNNLALLSKLSKQTSDEDLAQ